MDPNQEVRRTKGTRYVNADWSDYSRTKRSGLQEVAVETVVYADGRVKEFILDGSGNRFADPVRQDFDEDQRKAWDAQKKDQPDNNPTVSAPPSQPSIVTRRPDGSLATTPNPNYTPPESQSKAPPGGKPFIDDDEQAREHGRRWGWNPETKAYDRNLGPSPTAQEIQRNASLPADQDPRAETDAERRARGKENEAKAERDRQTAQAAADRNKPTTQTHTINGQVGYRTVTTPDPDGGQPTVKHYDPTGKEIPSLPVETGKSRTPVKGRPGIYEVKEQKGSNVETYFEDEAGNRVATPPREGLVTVAGLPALDTSTAEAARRTYLEQVRLVQAKVAAGELTAKEAQDLLTPSYQAAQSVIDGEQQQIENARAARTQDITLEGNRLSAATSQFANSRQGVDDAIRWGPVGGNEAATTYLNNLLVQQLMNQNTRGNIYPPVQAGGPANPLPAPGATIAPTGYPAIDGMTGATATPPAPDMTPAPQPIANPDGTFSSPDGGVYERGVSNYTPQPGPWFQTPQPTDMTQLRPDRYPAEQPQAMTPDPYAGYEDAPPAMQRMMGLAIKNRILSGGA